FAVARSAQGRGLGRRMLELALGLVPAGRPLWLFTAAGGSADRAAAAAGWSLDHTATDWILSLNPDSPGGQQAPPRTPPNRA
ncbi:MAG TPA: GNAT family N-acetyltransferase, partial [Actinomycetes bacterium]|nr:GNAT family N-acetyltransferase [Actinomycetes bacterium]